MFDSIFKFINKHLALLRLLLASILILIISCILVSQVTIRIDSADLLLYDHSNTFEPLEPLIADSPAEEIKIVRISTPIFFNDIYYTELYDINAAVDYINVIEDSCDTLSNAIVSDEYSFIAIAAMEDEYNRLIDIRDKIQIDIDRYRAYESEYYYATKTYLFLKQRGYSDAVTCGIIGNMMIETSGGTLDLNPYIYGPNNNYYGLCQWHLEYYPGANKWSFDQQLQFLHESMTAEFKVFGRLYAHNYTYDDFLLVNNAADAAYIFAKVYERCSPISFNMRRQAAQLAYEYFCTK